MMARGLDANGAARVYILGRREKTLQSAASKAINGTIIPIVADVTSKDSLAAAAARISAESGHVDVVIANAGATSPGTYPPGSSPSNPPTIEALAEYMWSADISAFTNVAHVAVTGTYYTAAAFLPLLIKANSKANRSNPPIHPQIIATSSVASFNRTPAATLAYAAAKAGLNHLMKSLSTLLAPYGIRANVIAPGFYLSELATGAFKKIGIQGDGTQEGDFPYALVPAKRAGSEEDMVGVTLFLCGRSGAYVNGTIILSDGGRLGIQQGTY
ncbi:NAD(P)-binding protein [Lepidopterella palustris CBS 459.81]|uniref:NAD(P)-binding protein n=1 Tax=Lepidopterella palustris CBS 459.81 TaxID=1314670 RepID=A0A8E2DZB8_9PEZI|nr:NAD(P)-binding protein [Lepidopterella palustris CBS 459.81]